MCVSTISSGTSRQRSAVLCELECLMESFDIFPCLSPAPTKLYGPECPRGRSEKERYCLIEQLHRQHNTSHTHVHAQGQHLPRCMMHQYAVDK
jgi:hypothetical protein